MTAPHEGDPFAVRRANSLPPRILITVIVSGVVALGLLTHGHPQSGIYESLVHPSKAFVASPELKLLAKGARMTADGQRAFLGAQPQLLAAGPFDKACDVHPDDFITGCTYDTGSSSIYLFRVVNPRLLGLAEVTAAHEMLHAVWNSMTDQARADFVPLLDDEYVLHKAVLRERLKSYGTLAKADWYNELHSIVGTEVTTVDPTLRAHYAGYLADREALVAAGQKSDRVLADADQRERRLAKQLDAIRNPQSARYSALYARYQLARDANSRLLFDANAPVDP